MHDDLIKEIETYCREANLAITTFGRKATNDGKFVNRIRNGGRCWPETEEKVRRYIANNPPTLREAA